MKVTLKDCCSPAGRSNGKLNPLIAKPAPLGVTCVTVRLEPPVFVRVSVSVNLLPTRIFPKFRLEELGVTVPAVCEPPESATLTVAVDPVFAMARFPVTVPDDAGVKMTVKPWLWPDARVSGKLNPLTLKPAPEGVTFVTVRLDPPELVIVAGLLWVFPTSTIPKLMLVGETVTSPGLVSVVDVVVDDLFELLRPWQPNIDATARSTTSAFQRAGSCLIIEDPVVRPDLLVRVKASLSDGLAIG